MWVIFIRCGYPKAIKKWNILHPCVLSSLTHPFLHSYWEKSFQLKLLSKEVSVYVVILSRTYSSGPPPPPSFFLIMKVCWLGKIPKEIPHLSLPVFIKVNGILQQFYLIGQEILSTALNAQSFPFFVCSAKWLAYKNWCWGGLGDTRNCLACMTLTSKLRGKNDTIPHIFPPFLLLFSYPPILDADAELLLLLSIGLTRITRIPETVFTPALLQVI